MLHTFFALLKFNAFSGVVSIVYLLFMDTNWNRRKIFTHADDELWVVGLWSCFWIITNIWIITTNRQRIAHSVVDKSIDIAASAMDFRDAAKQRVQERRDARKK